MYIPDFAPIYMIESLADAGPVLVSKAVAPKGYQHPSDAEIEALFENITPDAVIEQALTYSDQSFDSIMGIYIRSTSEVEREAIRLVVMGEDWERHYSEYLDEVFYFVTRLEKVDGTLKQITWAKCFREDLRSDAIFARSVGDTDLAAFFDSMVDDLSALWIDTQAERSQYIRKQPRW